MDEPKAAVETEVKPDTTETLPEAKEDKKFSQAEVESIIKERLDREKRKASEMAAKEREKAVAEEMAKNQEWEKLAKQRETDLAELQRKLHERETLDLKRAVAVKHGLPEAFIDRLKGETAEDLEADAKAIAEILPKPQKPSPGPTNPGNNQTPERKNDKDLRAEVYGSPGNVFDPTYASKIGGGIIEHNKEER